MPPPRKPLRGKGTANLGRRPVKTAGGQGTQYTSGGEKTAPGLTKGQQKWIRENVLGDRDRKPGRPEIIEAGGRGSSIIKATAKLLRKQARNQSQIRPSVETDASGYMRPYRAPDEAYARQKTRNPRTPTPANARRNRGRGARPGDIVIEPVNTPDGKVYKRVVQRMQSQDDRGRANRPWGARMQRKTQNIEQLRRSSYYDRQLERTRYLKEAKKNAESVKALVAARERGDASRSAYQRYTGNRAINRPSTFSRKELEEQAREIVKREMDTPKNRKLRAAAKERERARLRTEGATKSEKTGRQVMPRTKRNPPARDVVSEQVIRRSEAEALRRERKSGVRKGKEARIDFAKRAQREETAQRRKAAQDQMAVERKAGRLPSGTAAQKEAKKAAAERQSRVSAGRESRRRAANRDREPRPLTVAEEKRLVDQRMQAKEAMKKKKGSR